ncbi:Transcription initiation factor TFIID subunit 14 [Gracilariopsis chorda]|uniref:Transcription initiation factor TFIID subunit 14 n=1 Tax=Gracilariopsis chorda TaxID=448386 RepID=A0A2V3J0C8_9FLOR|nr:Transcription initiation factor TFIID subunit 14 [Gracilariopsis chorda]|eukprot:PXF47854.1 Transcription initiation factor TFIID subunit 14 [Gracilariopsis chorda]
MKRVKGVNLHIPVVHGSYAKHLGDKGTESRSHEWTVYLRPLQAADLSHFIKHVEFVLHESFEPQTRRVTEMPYEVQEYGWGEFEVVIRVFFQDPSEKPVEFFHPLRLFETMGEPSPDPVVSEHYDEIVFQDPPEKLHSLLKTIPHGPNLRIKQPSYPISNYFKDFSGAESNDLRKLEHARRTLREETIKRQAKYERLEEERAGLLRQISGYDSRAS